MTRLVFVFALFAIGSAAADPKSDAKIEAKRHIDRATAFHERGKFADALRELTVAYTLDPQPDLLYGMAQMHVQLGQCPHAIIFYERFLSSNPAPIPAAAAAEAIENCKHPQPARSAAALGTPSAPGVPRPPHESAAPAGEPRRPPEPSHPRWYTDKLGAALVVGGVVLGAVAIATYGSARGDLGRADDAADYVAYADLVDRARDKRTLAAVIAVGAVGLVAGGTARYAMRRRSLAERVALVPAARSGAVLVWSGGF